MELKPFHPEGLLPRENDLPEDPSTAELRERLSEDNARARLAFVQLVPCMDRDEVIRNIGLPTAADSAAYAVLGTWKKHRHIFSVCLSGKELYPEFQFQGKRPHPHVALVLASLPANRTSWQMAFWFVSPNSWLDGDAPATRLDDLQEIITAAQHEAEDIEA